VTRPDGGRSGPSVVLIGGEMVTDDGTRLDSRQPLQDDHRSEVMLRTLSTSLLWWQSAASLVTPIITSTGTARCALVMSGTRSVLELRHDGTYRRTRLSGLLPGGTTTTELIRIEGNDALPAGYQEASVLRDWSDNHYIATIAMKPGKPGKRWHFLRYDFYLAYCIPAIAPAAFVDATLNMFDGNIRTERGPDGSARLHGATGHRFHAFERSRLYHRDAVLILPHTSANETFLTRYSAWVAAGKPSTATDAEDYYWMRPAWQLAADSGGNRDKTPDRMDRTVPTPIEANFRVTGLMEDAQWRDASHLEASRALLQTRFDLRIGIWDLARNPTLRQTLLDATPIAAAPTTPAAVPPAAHQRAMDQLNATIARRDDDRETWLGILAHFDRLTRLGWVPDEEPTRGRKWHLYLPLTKPHMDQGQVRPIPLAQLHLSVSKQHNSVELTARQGELVGIERYLRARPGVFGWAENLGWGDEVNWTEWVAAMASRTIDWIVAFDPLREVYERLNGDVPPRPRIADLPSMWRRDDGGVQLTAPLRGIQEAEAAEQIAALTVGDHLALRREPFNRDDPNTIAVHNRAGRRLGYLAHQVARLLAPVIDQQPRALFGAALASRPEPDPPAAAHHRWDPMLRHDQVTVCITSDPGATQ